MTTNSTNPRRLIPWPARVTYPPGRTRKQRQAQHRQQINALFFVVLAAALFGLVAVWINYQNAGSSKAISCDTYPQYCVPRVGGSTNDAFANTETAASRTLDEDSHGAEGVVRGIVDDTMPFIGNPDAPIEFAIVAAFSCTHCREYHSGDLEREIRDFALTGQAVFRSVLIPRYDVDLTATQAVMCAGEQGAYWEMSDELFRLASAESVSTAFTTARLKVAADDMDLDGAALVACLASNRYKASIEANQQFANDSGVTGTPTVLMRTAGSDQWTIVDRDYNSIKVAVEAAIAAQP